MMDDSIVLVLTDGRKIESPLGLYPTSRGCTRRRQDLPTETAKTKEARAIPIPDFFKRRELMIFLASVVLFHFGNAAMLPMAGQVLAKTHREIPEKEPY